MKAIILAAGRGSRMKNLTNDKPKCLVELHGKTLLERQLCALRSAGIEEIGIVTGYKRELLECYGLHEFYNERWAETNMVASLACARKWLSLEPCIVSYSDIFYESRVVETLMHNTSALAITYDPDWKLLWQQRFEDPLVDAETFRVDTSGVLMEIGGRPTHIEEIQGQYMGLLKFTPKSWFEVERIRESLPTDEADNIHMTGTLQKIVDSGNVDIVTLPATGDWGEVDSESDLRYYAALK